MVLLRLGKNAIQCNAVIKSDYGRLKLTGKTPKVALIACMRRLMTILNTMVKKYTHWAMNPIGFMLTFNHSLLIAIFKYHETGDIKMSSQSIIEIKNAKNEIDELLKLNEIFLANAQANSTSQQILSKLEVSESEIVVPCFGCYTATARPRIVRSESGDFFVEYAFFIELFDERYEICQFYLTPQGSLTKEIAPPQCPICDYNNTGVATYICDHVLHSALQSTIFDPTLTLREDDYF
jgi:hypothetical protein